MSVFLFFITLCYKIYIMKVLCSILVLIIAAALSGCSKHPETEVTVLFEDGAYPSAVEHNGTYYYIMQGPRVGVLTLYSSSDISKIAQGETRDILKSEDYKMHNFYSPELHRIKDKWYVYFEADDGDNTDNHQLYVLENPSDDPMSGEWSLHGPIITDKDWNFGLHPSTFVVKDRQYLIWSGWPKRRIENETQCIFIAEMSNPWTTKSERVMISQPEYEWERQWINPDGSRSPYPIFVNENPQPMVSPDGRKIIIAYSASGIWTVYNTLGILSASTDADLLNPTSWVKLPEPQFTSDNTDSIYGTSNIAIIPSSDFSEYIMLYQAKQRDSEGEEHQSVRMKRIVCNEQGFPVFGKP